ncbi:MAG: hypothetical protein L6Q92_00815 [Phycisphaerae bacterium]|nr:hypothetical protein [Phycisphaerae bacterium]
MFAAAVAPTLADDRPTATAPQTGAGLRFDPDATPEKDWPASEARRLSIVRQLTDPTMGLEKSGEAYFSPDQRMIIFQAIPRGELEYQMYTLQLDSSGRAVRGSLRRVSPPGGACTCGYFHPNGREILFSSSHLQPGNGDESLFRGRSGYNWPKQPGMEIFAAHLDGSKLRRLTTTPGYDAEASYSPDGRRIVFTSCRDDGNPEIYVMHADGSNPRRITHAAGYDGGPFFSPDGKRIVFRGDRRENDLLQLFVIDADGRNERQLTNTDYVNWGPYWHPNGRTIAFATSAHGHMNYEIYLMNIETMRIARLTYSPGFDGLPVFSADGRCMMWTSKRGPDKTSQVFVADVTLPEGF